MSAKVKLISFISAFVLVLGIMIIGVLSAEFDESSVPVDLSAFTFTTSGSNATLTSYTGTDAEVVIPSTISLAPDGSAISGDDYTVTAIATGTSSSGPFYSARSTLTSITIPETMKTIGKYAFRSCTALTEINYNATAANDLSDSNYVFSHTGRGRVGIIVNIGANVTRLPDYIFHFSYNITTVNFAEGSVCESIGEDAFSSCYNLTSITIPDSVTSIGNGAFSNCDALAEVYNYSNLTITAGSASNGYVGYYAKVIHDLNPRDTKPATRIKADNGIRYYDDGENAVVALYPLSKDITTVSLDSRTTEINQYAFSSCDSLTSITIGEGVTSIGESAFFGCSSLTSITINAITPPTLGSSAIPSSETNIYVPEESVDAYKVASGWSSYSNKISAIVNN